DVPPTANVIVVAGQPAAEIVEHAKRQSDVIVIGAPARSEMTRLAVGSVVEDVVMRASCAVMTVPSGAHPNGARDAFDPILCAVDFSPACARAVDLAIAFAQEGDARLILLHALQVPSWAAERRDQLRSRAVLRL